MRCVKNHTALFREEQSEGMTSPYTVHFSKSKILGNGIRAYYGNRWHLPFFLPRRFLDFLDFFVAEKMYTLLFRHEL